MNGLIQELTNELKNNSSVNSSIAAKVVLESINNSLMLGVANDQILENSLNTLDQFATELVNENIKEVHGSSTHIRAPRGRCCPNGSPNCCCDEVVHRRSGQEAQQSYGLLYNHRQGRLKPDVVGQQTSWWR